MRVMQRAVIEYRDTKPLPSTMTDVAVKGATLPVKIEAARRAIAECVDLPELLRYRDQAEGLAAAVRTMKHVGPELIRNANEMMADAWRKGGELLSAYSNVASVKVAQGKKGFQFNKGVKSERGKVAEHLGLTKSEVSAMVRIHKAPASMVYRVAETSRSMTGAATKLPAYMNNNVSKYSVTLKTVMSGVNLRSEGLNSVMSAARGIPLETFRQLTPDERKVVKAKICEIMELLDEMDRLCK